MENCGIAKLSFRNAKLKLNSDSPEKLKETSAYVNIKCYPYNEFIKVALGEEHNVTERHIFL